MSKEIQKIVIHTPFIKLGDFLKFASLAQTGGIAKRMIENNLVRVNGEVSLQRGQKLLPGCVVEVDDKKFEVFAFED